MLIASVIGVVPSVIGQFRRDNPSIDINLHRIEMLPQQRGLVAGELDMGIVKAPADLPTGLAGFTVAQLQYAVILPVGHPMAERTEISPSELVDESFVSMNVDPRSRFGVTFPSSPSDRNPESRNALPTFCRC